MIVNIKRDSVYCSLNTSENLGWSTDRLVTENDFNMNSDGSVKVDFGCAKSDKTTLTAINANSYRGIGLLFTPPTTERVPFRVKAYAGSQNDAGLKYVIGIGYAPDTPSGLNDLCNQAVFLPMQDGHFDDLIMIENIPTTQTEYGRAIAFALLVLAPTAGGGDYITGNISVQNLGVSEPTMQFAVS